MSEKLIDKIPDKVIDRAYELKRLINDKRIGEKKKSEFRAELEEIKMHYPVLFDGKKENNPSEENAQPKKKEVEKDEDNLEKSDKGLVNESVSDGEYSAEIIKDYYGRVDPFHLSSKDPKYQYRFVRMEDKNLSIKTGNLLFSKGGWQICPREHLKRIGLERFLSPDGMYRVGDTVLCFMPKDLYAEKNAEKVKRANAQIDAVNRMSKEGDPFTGGRDIHGSMKGIQTQKDLGL